MARKCGFFDCSNLATKKGYCQSCEERKEKLICAACRQPQEYGALNFHPSLLRQKYLYELSIVVQDKLPTRFQSEFNQLLPQLKLSTSEQELIAKAKKLILDFLASKGGKQDHIDWLLFCSACNPEIVSQMDNLIEKNPQNKKLGEGIKEKETKLGEFIEKVKEAASKEEWKKFEQETEEEFYSQIAINSDPNRRPNQQGPGQPGQPQPNQNQEKIAHLQREIDSLKQEIRDLKKPGNSSPSNSDTLQEKENKLREKEKELDKLNKNNNSPSNNQPSKNGNSNLPLYFGLGIVGVIIIFLIASLIAKKKKKKNIIYAYHK